ncbi:hypothetical protein [Sinorhizobium sp. BG8]|uniref:hypothetical protein n=1 Tax=Sinorhizobium sp. BG8 TaxID=2613773 RepID=UPI00193CE116|nr:hypothetical protein [Sinorhizobium sp. BG8]QRM55131.1 hypothetical protein F3Y30_11755 [Sinorhizobium sp. BG8]
MNELREGIAEIAAATNDAERAAALLRCSLSLLMTCEFTLRNRFMLTGFHEGIAYLDAELLALRTPRDAEGGIVNSMAVDVGRGRMRNVAAGLPASRMEAP